MAFTNKSVEMKVQKSFIISAWILLFNTGLFGQEFSKSEILKHKIKSITLVDESGGIKKVSHYNEEGNLVSTGVKAAANIITNKELIYNDHKLLVEEKNFNPLGNLHFTHKFTYNNKKQLVKKEAFDSENILESTWEYEYDNKGNLEREMQKSKNLGNNETKYKYEKGRLAEEETTNETLGKEEKITFRYNGKGLLLEQKIKSYFTNSSSTISFTYNGQGKLIRQVDKTEDEVDGQTVYEYDNQGLLQKHTTKNSDGLTEITTYKFEFF
jgi:YD repeat-containing protein